MRFRRLKRKNQAASLRKRFDLERLDSRLLLSATSEWLGGINPDSIDIHDSQTSRLLDDLSDVFHAHSHEDGAPGSYYSDPTSWDLSPIFGSDITPDLNELHQWVDSVFQSDHDLQSDGLLEDNLDAADASAVDAYVSEEVLAAGGGYVLYLDFDGGVAQGRSSDSWLYNYNANVPAYDLSQYGWAGQENESINYITEFVREDYAAYNVSVVTDEPTGGAYTTIFVGGNNDWFQAGSGVIGVATYDVGNTRASNYGFAFTEELSIYYNYSGGELANFSEYVANLVSHEAGHTFGANHIDDTAALMNPYLPLSPRTSMFGVNKIYGSSSTQDTQSLLGNNLGYAHGNDDFGDIFSAAQPIVANSTLTGVLERRDDVDVFQFTAANDATLTVDLDTTDFGNLDSLVSIYRSSDSSLIAQNDDDGNSEDSLLTFSATEGETYYVMVSSFNGETSGTYNLTLGTNLNWEPDAQIDVSAVNATPVELNQYGNQTFSDSLSNIVPQQVYQIVLDVNGTVNIDLNDDGFGAYAAMYDANGILLDWDFDSGLLDTVSLASVASTWEAYYLVVGGIENSGTGDYQLNIESPDIVTSEIILNGSGEGVVNGSISVGDSDYFRFNAPDNAAGLLVADISNSGDWDVILNLYNSNGQLVSRVDTNGASVGEVLAVESIVPGETYTLRIADVSQQDGGEYNLNIQFALPAVEPQIEATDSLNSLIDHVLDFDRLTVNTIDTATMTIRNTGLLDLVISELTVGNGFSLNTFSAAQNSSDDLVIAPGQSLPVSVTFQPDQVGTYNTQIVIVSNDSEQSTLLLELTGEAHAPEADISTEIDGQTLVNPTLDFGNIIRGQSLTQTVTITNNGYANLIISDIETTSPMTLVTTVPSEVMPGESVDLIVEIFADQRGALDSTLSITTNDPDSPLTEVQIQAQVLGGVLTVQESVQTANDNDIDFGAVLAGTRSEHVVTLTNSGDADLTISEISTTLGFDVTSLLESLLPVGESLTLTVSYSPTVLTDLTGTLSITTDNIESPEVEIDLQASTLAGVLEITELDGLDDGELDFGRQRVHITDQINVWQLSNHGNIPVTVTVLTAHDRDFHVLSETQVVIPAGGNHIVKIEFNTDQARQVTEQLILQANDFYQTSTELGLTADGYALIGQGEKYDFIDHSGDKVRLSLSGEATAEVIIGQANEPDIAAVTLLSGSGEETLKINVKGGGRTLLGELTGEGSLKRIIASKVDLVGEGINLDGQLESLRLGNVLAGADIHFSSEEGANINLKNIVGDSDISIEGGLKKFTSHRFSGGRLTTDFVKKIKINGSLDSQVTVLDGDLDRLLIRDGSLGGDIQVQGNIGKLIVKEGNLSGNISSQGAIGQISVKKGSLSSTIQSEDTIGKIFVENMTGADISVLNGIDKVSVSQDMADSNIVIGFTEASESQNANATLPIDVYLSNLKVKGAFSASNVAVGVAPDNDGNFLNGFAVTSGGTIGRITLNQVDVNNQSNPFGLIARSEILKLKVNQQRVQSDYQLDNFHVAILSS